MMWKRIMLAACGEPLFNWRLVLTGVDLHAFRHRFLDPASGYTGVVRCVEAGRCQQQECRGLRIRELSTGTTACCPHVFSGPKIPVSGEDLLRCSLSCPRFHAELCHLLGLTFSNTAQDDFFWELGTYRRGAALFLPVYISYYHTQGLLAAKVRQLLSAPHAVFALVVFDYSMLSRAVAAELAKRGCLCVSMPELASVQPDAALKLETDPEHIFNIFKETRPERTERRYRCESGTTWSDIHINFADRETVTIWRRGCSSFAASYGDLGMINRRNNRPSRGFSFLTLLLERKTQSIPVPAKSNPQYPTLIQRKHEICKALQAFFPDVHDGAPIVFDKTTSCYQLRFQIAGSACV